MTPLLFAITALAISSSAGAAVPSASARDAATPQQTASPTAAPRSIASEIIVLHGTNDNSGIDPKIGKMPALSKPPFSSYNSYKLLDRTSGTLAKGAAAPFKLPTGREQSIIYKDVIEPQKQGEARRFVVQASIQKADGKSVFPLMEVNAKAGEWFFVGGQEYKGGGLVIGIKVNP